MKFLVLIPALIIFVTGCTFSNDDPSKPNVEVIQDMAEQPALKAQDFHPQDREKSSMLVPPKGTWPSNTNKWPKDMKPLMYEGKPEQAGRELKNPFAGNPEVTELGKRHFQNYCMVCHGVQGAGDGPVAEKFVGVKPPSLLTAKIKNYPDGRIYHIITYGQGVMGAYVNQMPNEKARWAVVNYVRQLQK